MTPFWSDDWLTIYGGDCRDVMRQMRAESVHCVVTSPPYWGLRDYGTASWDGGDADCDHLGPSAKPSPKSTLGIYADGRSRYTDGWDSDKQAKADFKGTPYRHTCGKCGARRIDSQLGLEPDPESYVAAMVDVFREVRRVLRPDGTVWLNLGDSYANDTKWGGSSGGKHVKALHGQTGIGRGKRDTGLKPKDLVGIPWRVAFALQADGWYLRSDIVWAKPNPMPESVTDRPTKSHEYLFLLTRSPRYFYDADAVREPLLSTPEEYLRAGKSVRENHAYGEVAGRPLGPSSFASVPNGRNLRSVWTIATAPYPGAHFATFPPKLVEPCVKAGTSERGVCPDCGAPWVRVSEYEHTPKNNGTTARNIAANAERGITSGQSATRPASGSVGMATPKRALGWRPSCDHDAEPVPAVVMDIFAGTGTVGMVAQSLSRRAVLIDLNPEYLRQCLERNQAMPLGLGS